MLHKKHSLKAAKLYNWPGKSETVEDSIKGRMVWLELNVVVAIECNPEEYPPSQVGARSHCVSGGDHNPKASAEWHVEGK